MQYLQGRRQDDRERARQMAHAVKGIAGNLSAKQLFERARVLEGAIKEDHLDNWALLLEQYEQALEEVMESIAALPAVPAPARAVPPPEQNGETEATLDLDRVQPQLELLARQLQDGAVDAETTMAELSALLVPAPKAVLEARDAIAGALDQFDFETALKALKQLTETLEKA